MCRKWPHAARLWPAPRDGIHLPMSALSPPPAAPLGSPIAEARWRPVRAMQRLIGGYGEGAVVAITLGLFAVLWLVFHTVALAPVDLRDDASEAALWAQHFAFGYKHPPMTAWLFMAWFAVLPRADWAMHLAAVTLAALALFVAWRLSRDHLDRDRALLGLGALILVPLYTFKAAELNANTAMMPFWAAALLFYLRARRGLGRWDSLLAGAFASCALLGKYWAVYLFAGMALASVVGAGTRRFWRSPSPYLMAAGAIVVIAPHLYWYAAQDGGSNYAFVRDSVMTADSFGTALARSVYYLLGVVAFAAGPLVLLALLRPSRAALADIVWPADDERRQAVILFVVPMLLPALVNLFAPYRLTPDWTFPNWPLLPIVLYGSRKISVDSFAAAGAALLALAVSLGFVAAAPLIGYAHLKAGLDSNRPSSQEVAQYARQLGARPALLYWGSADLVGNLPFYLPGAKPLDGDPLSPAGRGEIAAQGLLIVCLDSDAPCRTTAGALGDTQARAADVAVRRTFLGFSGPPYGFHIAVLPARQ